MKIALFMVLILTASCASMEGKVYKFNGRVTQCKKSQVSECGIMLYDCVDGYTYQCLMDVKVQN